MGDWETLLICRLIESAPASAEGNGDMASDRGISDAATIAATIKEIMALQLASRDLAHVNEGN